MYEGNDMGRDEQNVWRPPEHLPRESQMGPESWQGNRPFLPPRPGLNEVGVRGTVEVQPEEVRVFWNGEQGSDQVQRVRFSAGSLCEGGAAGVDADQHAEI